MVDAMSQMLDGKVSVAQIYRYEAAEKSPSLVRLGEMGYSVYTLYQANGLPESTLESFADQIAAETDMNGMLSNREFESILAKYKQGDVTPVPETDEKKEKQPGGYESKLMKLETKIGKMYHPETEEEKELARASITRIRVLLDQLEESF